ncbi:ABC transporter permease [archaeon]|jgi:putative ABC transport system permease protein|nr:ABC transporter permease [archaeon]MBT4023022.1 ABC transporter permease [archaeon]MBT4272013.1 ABC transporter permease [archaeon]MBT4461851.1 ABC transporter permease [archaeon]MBT4857918.1 ABC transporter permease [archaeon]
MKFYKSLKQAINMVMHAKLRSWLTILGIVIGVAAVVAIVSLGEGLQQSVNSQFSSLGADLLTLRAGASRASGFGPGRHFPESGGATAVEEGEEIELDKSDVQALKGVSDIKLIDTQISGKADIYYVAEKGSVTVTGVDPAIWAQITTSKILQGRMLGPADSNVIVVGGKIASGFFDKNLGVNQLVTIEDRLFRIVGILDDSSTSVYMPISFAYEVLEDKEREVYDTIIIKVKDEDQIEIAMNNTEKKLMQIRHVTDKTKDFTLTSNQASNDARTEMMSSMTSFLTAIAAVALLVGSVGIANTMFTSVLEKTKDIGIMKAIGAKNKDILIIFLLNAALIGLIGGLLGAILGTILSGLLPSLMGQSGGMMSRLASGSAVSMKSIIMALSVSVFIGISAGTIPAIQASKLKPVDALRYE